METLEPKHYTSIDPKKEQWKMVTIICRCGIILKNTNNISIWQHEEIIPLHNFSNSCMNLTIFVSKVAEYK